MIIDELSCVLLDITNIKVIHNGKVMAEYNGKDSIDVSYNSKQILKMYVDNNYLVIEV